MDGAGASPYLTLFFCQKPGGSSAVGAGVLLSVGRQLVYMLDNFFGCGYYFVFCSFTRDLAPLLFFGRCQCSIIFPFSFNRHCFFIKGRAGDEILVVLGSFLIRGWLYRISRALYQTALSAQLG